MDLLDLRDGGQCCAGFRTVTHRSCFDLDEGELAAIKLGRIEPDLVAVDNALALHLANPFQHSRGSHLDLARHLDIRNPSLLLQYFQYLYTDGIKHF